MEHAIYQSQPFSPTHIITVIILSAVWGKLIGLGLRWQGESQLAKLEKGFAVIYLFLWIACHGWLLPENLIGHSLCHFIFAILLA